MIWLPDGEKNLKIYLFVSTEYTNVADGWIDRQTYTALMHSMARQQKRYEKPPLAARCCHVANDLISFTGDRRTDRQTDSRRVTPETPSFAHPLLDFPLASLPFPSLSILSFPQSKHPPLNLHEAALH